MKSHLRFVWFIFSGVLFFSCSDNIPTVQIEISSPKTNWIYYSDSEIVFSSNIKSPSLHWYSSLDGEIGTGWRFSRKLSSGEHIITLNDDSGKSCHIKLNVILPEKNQEARLITKLPFYVEPDCEGSFGIISLDGGIYSVTFESAENEFHSENIKSIQRDIALNNVTKGLRLCEKSINSSRNAVNEEHLKSFYVLKTSEPGATPNTVIARKFYDNSQFSIWISEDFNDVSSIYKVINSLESFVLRRVKQLWGDCADIDSDKKIAILFTPTINAEKKAVGFFNSKDFFKKVTDKKDAAYNPYSNEMDLIYVAIPDDSDKNYTVESIIATIAHEFTHAINFSNKTWKKCFAGEKGAVQEDIFLDEGESHLTELLCGYGKSGGDLDFINYYLDNSIYYSFCKNDYLGRNDSVGQRGAVCLFLYWLFEKAGGIEYESGGIGFIDKGGISFLRSLANSSSFGWDCIGEYFEKDTDRLFMEFSKELLLWSEEGFFLKLIKDPVTQEEIFFNKGLKDFSLKENYKILPYSIAKIGCSDEEGSILMSGNKLYGNVYIYE